MSYILDALKKADAERERGTIPGIHAQPAGGSSAQAAPPVSAGITLWISLGAAVVVSGSIAWRIWRDQPTHPVAVEIAKPTTPELLPGRTPARVSTESAAASSTSAAAVTTAAAPTARAVEIEAIPPRAPPSRTEPAVVARKPTPAPVVAAVVPKPVQPVQIRTAVAASAPAHDKVFTLAEMPNEIRRELPPMTVSGAIYSENVANRFLIINGQIFHETDTPAPGVVLLKIKLKSAVLSFKGHRYSVTY